MKEEGTIKVQTRVHSGSGANNRMRKEGYLPGVIYGHGMEPISIRVKKDELAKSIQKFGRNSVFKLDLDGEKSITTKIKDIQNYDIMGGDIHVDFQKIILSEETKANVMIRIIGKESMEAKKLIVLQHLDNLPVKGLPRSIPEHIDIDVSKLNAGDTVSVEGLVVPKGITIDIDLDHLVVGIKESFLQQSLAEEVETVSMDEVNA